MVEPISREDRDAANRKLQIGFVALVTVSAGLITLQADPSTAQIAAAMLGGFVIGVVLLWYLRRLAAEFAADSRADRRRGGPR